MSEASEASEVSDERRPGVLGRGEATVAQASATAPVGATAKSTAPDRASQEREAIWEIQITKYGRQPGDFDLVQLARATGGLTGSEIENAFVEALYLAFDQEKELQPGKPAGR